MHPDGESVGGSGRDIGQGEADEFAVAMRTAGPNQASSAVVSAGGDAVGPPGYSLPIEGSSRTTQVPGPRHPTR
jgi:hypothetical protein